MAYSDWQDHEDYDDGGYGDHHDHTDSDCVHTDWDDHADGGYLDYTDHDDSGAHTDWNNHSDHDDGAHTDWDDAHGDWSDEHIDWDDAHSDWGDHTNDAHGDWSDHDNSGHLDWGDAHSDWNDHTNTGDPHQDWTNYSDAGTPHLDWTDGGDHLNWSDAHTDWGNAHQDWTDAHADWTNHSNAGNPHLNWTDAHADWGDHTNDGHGDYTVHSNAGDPHINWSDGDPHSDWTNNHGDWTNHGDYDDHDDSGVHTDWDDNFDDSHTNWSDYSDGGVDEGKTQISGWIGGKDVTCYIIGADIWRDALNGIGRWQLILDNQGHWWGGAFTVDDNVTIRINGSLMMMGYVDDIFPYIDSKGEYSEYIRVNGRDYGMDLAQLYITQEYVNIDAKLIVQNALGIAGSEITYAGAPPWPGPINYEFDRTLLADGFRDIAKVTDHDFFVEDNIVTRRLHFFDIATMDGGNEHTTVDLESVAGAATNNILRLEIGENIGFDIKNTIEAHAGDLNDHWTDLNAVHWISGVATTAITDDLAFFVAPKGAIRIAAGANNIYLYADLIFPRYGHTSLDMSEPGMGRYAAYPHYPSMAAATNKRTEIRLKDTANNWIQYYSATIWPAINPPFHTTANNVRVDDWRYIEFAYGNGTVIRPVGTWQNETWQYVGAAVTFNWNLVDTIRLGADNMWLNDINDWVVFDELKIPAIEVISTAVDGTPIGGTRMKEFYRPDIKNQVELDAYATDQLAKYQDPVQSVKITAIGQVDSNYAAQSLDVLAPSSGITPVAPATHVPYRIFTLHHSVKLSPLKNEIIGYDYITDYELIRHIQSDTSSDQLIAPTRVAITHSPTRALMRELRERGRSYDTVRRIR